MAGDVNRGMDGDSNELKSRRQRELSVAQYVQAMDRGDLDALEAILARALDDPELDRQLARVDEALHAEAGLPPPAGQALLVRALLRRHLPSAFPEPPETVEALTVGDVAGRLQTDELAQRRLSAADRLVNRQLLGSRTRLPVPATGPAIARLTGELGVAASDRYWETFRQSAVILAMARHQGQVELAAARRGSETRGRSGGRPRKEEQR